ncbi:unnamed protein product [Gadus morhua 'NCC']
MDEEREDGGSTSKTTLSVEHGRRSKAEKRRQERADSPGPSCVSMKSEHYMGELQRIRSEFVKGVSEPVIKGLLDDLWQQKVFSSEEKDYVMAERTKADQARCLIDMVMGKGEKASHVMIDSMKKRDQHLCSTLGLMSSLPGVGSAAVQCQHKIKSNLQKKFRCVFEGIAKAGHSTPLNEFYTEIFITKRGSGEVNQEHEVVFIFDGLDECQLPLDFKTNPICTDVTEVTSVDVLLTNLIRGKLLTSACIWITTRPAAADKIPAECVNLVTEVRGFTDPQKEIYFRKKFTEETLAKKIIAHIKKSRSLHIMCHIPIFCWITATVLENFFKTSQLGEEMPKTITQMYSHFLRVQSMQGDRKYHGRAETDQHWSPESREIIVSLGELAFKQLEKDNLIFYEADLAECHIDIRAASVYSGVFTKIFKKEGGLYHDKVFCFVHLSIQEFLAALYVFMSFIDTGVNLLSGQPQFLWSIFSRNKGNVKLYQSAVDKALQRKDGRLDLFLRFLLGLSLETNQKVLKFLLGKTVSSSETSKKMGSYIKKKIGGDISTEKRINLFHCLNELNDHSLVAEIQQYLTSGRLSKESLSPAQWSTLVFILLTSEEELDVFDLKKYSPSEEGLLWLMPVVKASKTSL